MTIYCGTRSKSKTDYVCHNTGSLITSILFHSSCAVTYIIYYSLLHCPTIYLFILTNSVVPHVLILWPSSGLNVVVEWLTLLLRILEVLDSKLGPETSYPDWGISWFSSILPSKCWDSTLKLGQNHFLPNPFQLLIYFAPFDSTLDSLSYLQSIVK
jgi:hypothetical protein